LRCLKRRITDAIWTQLQVDLGGPVDQDQVWPRWPSSRQGHGPLPLARHSPPKSARPPAAQPPEEPRLSGRAVEAGRRPPAGEALTARSRWAVTMDQEARQGFPVCRPGRRPV
jgi:hypothetical protein